MRALVIGADGFAGRWLLRHLLAEGDRVVAAVGRRYRAPLPGDLRPNPLDVRTLRSVRNLLAVAKPECVYYLAGVSAPTKREDLARNLDVGIRGVSNLLTALSAMDAPARLLLVGSSHMYGFHSWDHPITEGDPLRPTTVYGAVKAAAEVMAFGVAASTGLEVVSARPFNHIGPGQQADFVAASVARQVVDIRTRGGRGKVRMGSLDVRRDFTDVRDVVRAYRLLALRGTAGEAYNVASGRSVQIRRIVEMLVELAGVEVSVVEDAAQVRPGERADMTGSPAKIEAQTGWTPTIPLTSTLQDLLAAT